MPGTHYSFPWLSAKLEKAQCVPGIIRVGLPIENIVSPYSLWSTALCVLVYCSIRVGLLLYTCWSTALYVLVYYFVCWSTALHLLVYCSIRVGLLLYMCWSTALYVLVYCSIRFSLLLYTCWSTALYVLVYCSIRVGLLLYLSVSHSYNNAKINDCNNDHFCLNSAEKFV